MTSTNAQARYEEQQQKKEQIKQAAATIMDLSKYQNEIENLSLILKQLEAIVKRESKRDMMDQHLTSSTLSLLEDEIIPMLDNELNYVPSCDTSYDGEPPLTMAEMHNIAWRQHQELHR